MDVPRTLLVSNDYPPRVGGIQRTLEALVRQLPPDRVAVLCPQHEGAAAFAASGYAKLTGRPAACLTIAGPGATNLLTGLWDAKVDRAPVLALTGQVKSQVLGPGTFQEVPLASAFNVAGVTFLSPGLAAALILGGMAVGCVGGLVAAAGGRA